MDSLHRTEHDPLCSYAARYLAYECRQCSVIEKVRQDEQSRSNDNQINYVTPAFFFSALQSAFARAFLTHDEALYTSKWHPEDLVCNTVVLVEGIGSYATDLIRRQKNDA